MKDNKEFIKGIYDKYDEYLKEANTTKFTQVKNPTNKDFKTDKSINKTTKTNLIKALSAIAACAVVVSGFLLSNNLINKPTINGKTVTKSELSLSKVNDFETFYKIVKDNYKEESRVYNAIDDTDAVAGESSKGVGLTPGAFETKSANASDTSVKTTSEPTRNEDYSKTNTQVENVDEADIVKTNGNYIFYVVSNKVIIVDIQDQKMEKVAEISFENEKFTPSELYINDDNLIILGNERSYSYSNNVVKQTTNSVYKKGIYKQKSVAIVYDISKIEKPKEDRRVEIEGNYVSSRMIDNSIYFVSNKSIDSYNLLKEDIEDVNENTYKPTYVDTALSTREKVIDYDEIYYYDDIDTLNYLTLAGFNLNTDSKANIETFLGAGEDIYCSDENMYIVKTKNVYDADTRMSYGKDTKILKFSLKNGKIDFEAEADIDGGINNQFSMDENNGCFRVATTIGKTYNMDNSTSNSLYILDEKLNEVGRLDGIAPGEKIYSVRYVGDRAYVVTFKEIDPLFVIDLSDATNPKILGELKIPGYSTYLHPYDETHLIGFGYDTKDNGYGGVKNDGLKMSMFDITDFTNPKEMFTVKIGESGTSSPLTSNHKALLFSKEKNLIAFPISSYSLGKTKYKAQVYDIDLNKGFTLRGEIEHERTNSATSTKMYFNYNNVNIERIIYSKDTFYTLSKGLIKASDMKTLKEVSKLEID